MIICGVDLKYVNNNQWVDDDADNGGDEGDKNRKKPQNLNFLKSWKSHSKAKKSNNGKKVF